MRLRKQKNFDKRWQAVAGQYLLGVGSWRDEQERVPCNVELGCGKGKYLTAQAAKSPDVLHIGVERNQFALLIAMEAAQREGLSNIRFIEGDVERLGEWFGESQVNRLDILFCDPWPKDRNAKRRLTHRNFLQIYSKLLKNDAIICIRTDNVALFDFTLEELAAGEWEVVSCTMDLHGEKTPAVMTDYEQKFTALGVPICEVQARKGWATII